MILLGIDLETSGTDIQNDLILEVGAVLYDWDSKQPVRLMSEIIDPNMSRDDQFLVSEEITEITGITQQFLDRWGAYEKDVICQLDKYAHESDYIVAHFGAKFDNPVLAQAYSRCQMFLPRKDWLDTSIDIKYPDRITTRNLRHLAAEHGFLNPFPHRAVFDVLTMFKVMEHYDLDTIIARSKEPIICLQAMVSYQENDKAKSRGYRWHPPSKVWWKTFKQSDAEVEVAECGFRTMVLDKAPE